MNKLLRVVLSAGVMMALRPQPPAQAIVVDVSQGAPGYGASGAESECAIATNPDSSNVSLIAGMTWHKHSMVVFRTANGGTSWKSDTLGVTADGYTSSRYRLDPSVVFARGNMAYVCYCGAKLVSGSQLPNSVIVGRSTDGGQTWSRFAVVDADPTPTSPYVDKPFVAVGPDPTVPGRDNVYVAYSRNDGLTVAASFDSGQTFSQIAHIAGTSISSDSFGSIAVDETGSVCVVWSTPGGAVKASTCSTPTAGNLSFAAPVTISTIGTQFQLRIPPQPHRGAYAGPSIAVSRNPSFPNRYYVAVCANVSSNSSAPDQDTDVLCSYSDDHGSTWSTQVPVHASSRECQFLPWITVDQATGNPVVVYYDARLDTVGAAVDGVNNCSGPNSPLDCQHEAVHTFVSASTDGGRHWYERKLTAGPSDVTDRGSSSSDYAEYIGVTAVGGTIQAAWSSNYATGTDDLDYFFGSMAVGAVTTPQVHDVPADYSTVTEAIGAAVAGDTVRVGAGTYDEQVRLRSHVQVCAKPGATPELSGSAVSYRVITAPRAFNSSLVGFAVADFDTVGIRVEDEPISGALRLKASTYIARCSITGGQIGIRIVNAGARLDSCEIADATSRGVDVLLSNGNVNTGVSIKRSMITRSNSQPGSQGVHLDSSGHVDTLENNTIDGYACGVRVREASPRGAHRILRNCITGWDVQSGTGFGAENGGINATNPFGNSPINSAPVKLNNVLWGVRGTNGGYVNTTVCASCASVPPLYCGAPGNAEAPVQRYTLRIDSPAAPGNFPGDPAVGLVGARPVECAYDTLTRDTNVAADTHVKVIRDVIVPTGRVLTLNAGAELQFDGTDQSGRGLDASKNELTVKGRLIALGANGHRVKFNSGEPSPEEGDWWGVYVQGSDSLRYVELQHSDYGIVVASANATAIEYSSFLNNTSTDVKLGSTAMSSMLASNTFTVGGGTGIEAGAGSVIRDNVLTGSSATTAGISFVSGFNGSCLVQSDTIRALSAGAGIKVARGDRGLSFRNNLVPSNAIGFRVSGGAPSIGVYGDTASGNVMSANSIGLLVEKHGPAPCPSSTVVHPVVRNTRMSGGTFGIVVARAGGSPDTVDLGNWAERGLNSIVGNTHCIWNNAPGCGVTLARGNWFGSAAGPDTTNCLSNAYRIDYAGFLTAPPSGTGPVAPTDVGSRVWRLISVQVDPGRHGFDVQFETNSSRASWQFKIVDVSGRLIRTSEQTCESGINHWVWNRLDGQGHAVSSGLYFVRVLRNGAPVGAIRLVNINR